MKLNKIALTLAGVLAVGASLSHAQTIQQDVQRDINQQRRIEQGLQSGSLSVKETGRLEADEARIDRMEARDLRDGRMSAGEQARLNAAQNSVSREIYVDKHNATFGNPYSVSSERLQADVQRNINQEQRIDNGIKDGQLSNRQVARLERGQAHVDHIEANAARDGHVSWAEQRHIQHAENHQSARIHRDRVFGGRG